MWTVKVKTLEYALCDVCPVTILTFGQQPTVRDVLDKLGENSRDIKVLSSGGHELSHHATVDDQDSLHLTTERAQYLRQAKEIAEVQLQEERRKYIDDHPEAIHWFDEADKRQ